MFSEHFIERTKKNVQAGGRPFTASMEQVLKAAIPGRWADVQQVIDEGAGLMGEASKN